MQAQQLALEEVTSLSVVVPVRTISESNRSRHERWFTTRKRVRAQHQLVGLHLHARAVSCPWPPPVAVRLTRISAGELDDDNLRGSLKHVRDAIARWVGVDDKRVELVRYEYAQAHCKRGEGGVRIEVFPLVVSRRKAAPTPTVTLFDRSKG